MTDKTQDERAAQRDEDDSPEVEGHRFDGPEEPGKSARGEDELPGEGEERRPNR